MKAWSVELTAAEIQQEMYTVRPRRLLNLYSWTPLLPGSAERLRDYGGLAYDWTAGGTLADEDGPPISWGGPSAASQYVVSGTEYSFSATLTAASIRPRRMWRWRGAWPQR